MWIISWHTTKDFDVFLFWSARTYILQCCVGKALRNTVEIDYDLNSTVCDSVWTSSSLLLQLSSFICRWMRCKLCWKVKCKLAISIAHAYLECFTFNHICLYAYLSVHLYLYTDCFCEALMLPHTQYTQL